MTEETLSFQSDVARLLDIVAHALYSEPDVFLRELISNASDACDRLRYAALTAPELLEGGAPLEVRLIADKDGRTLIVADNGSGMNRDDLIENLGTIARSGTARFMEQLTGDARKDMQLIGQFGVGFYSAFMVADRVEVLTRKAGETQGWRWTSDGKGGFSVSEAMGDVPRGTRVTLHLKDGKDDYLEEFRLQSIVRKYSDHIGLPVRFGEGEGARALNRASALWTRSKSEVTADEYKEFYHHVAHGYDDPWLTVHWRAEGKIEYVALLFVPTQRPFDLFDPRRRHGVKLYVRRVFITEAAEGLLPPYLRFLRGVVDSEDLPLNVSREMLQHDPRLARIRSGVVKRVLQEITKKGDEPEFTAFWDAFGAVLKEGLYEDFENRDLLLKLARFRSTAGPGLVSLDTYVGRMKEGQEAIYTIAGDDAEALLKSPQLEGFRARGIEVLLLTDPVDEFWPQVIGSFAEKPLRSVTRGGADLGKIRPDDAGERPAGEATEPARDVTDLIALLKLTLGTAVKDVRTSERLTESPVCLVADEGDLDIHLERLLKQHKQLDSSAQRILEVNASHPLIRRLSDLAGSSGASPTLDDAAWLLLDQARILEGDPLPDPTAFARRLSTLMEKGLAA